MTESAARERADALVKRIAELAGHSGASFSTAESLTGGQLAAALAAGENSGDWFCGGIVAYQPEVKYGLLNVPRGPVVSATTAQTMASECARQLGSDFAVAVTGVGGPGPTEGEPAGTVYIAVHGKGGHERVGRHEFSGSPIEIMQQTIEQALTELLEAAEHANSQQSAP